jgi:xylulokinase
MTAAPAAVFIGLDLGTSGLKGVALADSGEVLASASAAYPTFRPAPGAAEQAPRDWIAATEAVTARLAGRVPARLWQGIGLSAMIPTLVTVTAAGEPTGPAVTWQDSRADGHGDELRELCGGDRLYRATGQWVDGRYLLPMFLRLAAGEPARAAATARLIAAKDFLFGWLTGEIATDPSTAAGFGCYGLGSGTWDAEVTAAAARLLPPLAPPSARSSPPALPALPPVLPSAARRPLRDEAAARLGCGPIPVCLGAADSVLGALGLGVREPGQVAYIAGTSNVIIGVSRRLVTDPAHRFLVTPLAEPGLWGLEMDLLATGSAIRWLAGLTGGGLTGVGLTGGGRVGHDSAEAALVALAAGVDPGDAPLVLPYFSPGEQGALWDPLLHGTFVGLRLGHGRGHLARGLVNGIVLESRRCLAVLDRTGDFGSDIAVAGGSAADPGFRADLADATRRRVGMPGDGDADSSARGAALLAARSIGGAWPPGPAAGPMPVAEPDSARAALWDALWHRYEHARQAISRHYHGCPAAAARRGSAGGGADGDGDGGRPHGRRGDRERDAGRPGDDDPPGEAGEARPAHGQPDGPPRSREQGLP